MQRNHIRGSADVSKRPPAADFGAFQGAERQIHDQRKALILPQKGRGGITTLLPTD
jgi:hypothetical protein